jgi:hypothetical protein
MLLTNLKLGGSSMAQNSQRFWEPNSEAIRIAKLVANYRAALLRRPLKHRKRNTKTSYQRPGAQ